MRISDWSSDVCSSDLRAEIMIRQDEAQGHGDVRNLVCKIEKSGRIRALVGEAAVPLPRFSFAEGPKMFKIGSRQVFTRAVDVARSEERRVGKECVSQGRSRWSPAH